MPLHFLESVYALETAKFNIAINSVPWANYFVIPTSTLINIVQIILSINYTDTHWLCSISICLHLVTT